MLSSEELFRDRSSPVFIIFDILYLFMTNEVFHLDRGVFILDHTEGQVEAYFDKDATEIFTTYRTVMLFYPSVAVLSLDELNSNCSFLNDQDLSSLAFHSQSRVITENLQVGYVLITARNISLHQYESAWFWNSRSSFIIALGAEREVLKHLLVMIERLP